MKPVPLTAARTCFMDSGLSNGPFGVMPFAPASWFVLRIVAIAAA